MSRGAETNLKVGAHVQRKAPEFFLRRLPPLFGFTSTINRFGELFHGG